MVQDPDRIRGLLLGMGHDIKKSLKDVRKELRALQTLAQRVPTDFREGVLELRELVRVVAEEMGHNMNAIREMVRDMDIFKLLVQDFESLQGKLQDMLQGMTKQLGLLWNS